MLYRLDKPNLKDTGASNHYACIEIRVRIQACMRDSVGVWPQGLEVVAEGFESLEDELYFTLQSHGPSPTEFIDSFLKSKFSTEDVTAIRRSFMRYLRKDLRFEFEGPMRRRSISVVNLETIERGKGWPEIADAIINHMIRLTAKDGVGISITKHDICNFFKEISGDAFLGFSEYAMDHALKNLMRERRIQPANYSVLYDGDFFTHKEPFSWGPATFVGYSAAGKTSGGLHLSSRSWKLAKEICKDLNSISRQVRIKVIEKEYDHWQQSKDIEIDNVIRFNENKMEFSDEVNAGLKSNPLIQLAIQRGSLTASDVVDLAIEVLRSNYNQI